MYIVILDASSVFGHLAIDPRQRKLTGIRLMHYHFSYTNLFYGLGTAPQTFIIFTATVCYLCRKLIPDLFDCCIEGCRALINVYIDDLCLFHENEETAKEAWDFLVALLKDLNFQISTKPGGFEPSSQVCIYLGIEFDFVKKQLRIPQDKMKKYVSVFDKTLVLELITITVAFSSLKVQRTNKENNISIYKIN